MMRVSLQVFAVFGVTRQAHTVSAGFGAKLIPGFVPMKGVARNAREIASLKTSTFDESVVVAARHPHRPVRPEGVPEKVRLVLDSGFEPFGIRTGTPPQHVGALLDTLSRSVLGKWSLFFDELGVTAGTDRGTSSRIELRRIDDIVYRRPSEVSTIPYYRIAVTFYVGTTGAVARFAGNPYLGHGRLTELFVGVPAV